MNTDQRNAFVLRAGLCALICLGTGQVFGGQILDDDATYPVRADLTLNYFPATVPPDPIFQGSQLTGIAQFYEYSLTAESQNFVPLVPPDPVDIGSLAAGDSFSITFIPTDPCFMARTCGLGFSFAGLAGNFGVDAFAAGNQQSSIIPIGSLPSTASGFLNATDANFGTHAVGTWDLRLREVSVPEPGTLALFGSAALMLLLFPARSRAVK